MKIAIIGGGISGLGAAWALSQRHQITVYEAEANVGGHAHTIDVNHPETKSPIPVDVGFIVYNEQNYPNLAQLFAQLEVQTAASAMSFAVSLDNGRLEYNGSSPLGLIGQKRNFFRPRHWTMVRDILRFLNDAPKAIHDKRWESASLGDYLSANVYGSAFIEDHLLPMGAAIWSCSTTRMTDFPAATFLQFFKNHGLLQRNNRPVWRTVVGGSREYVLKLTHSFREHILLRHRVTAVRRVGSSGVEIRDNYGKTAIFDHVVMATHGDQILPLLMNPKPRETEILGSFRCQPNVAFLHSDSQLMPKRRNLWSAWNYMGTRRTVLGRSVSVTYWMNLLQSLPRNFPLFVSLNPLQEPASDKIHARLRFNHPLFDAAAVAAQRRIEEIQGQNRLWFCGAWCGNGFHEDGLTSGLRVAAALGSPASWWQKESRPCLNLAS